MYWDSCMSQIVTLKAYASNDCNYLTKIYSNIAFLLLCTLCTLNLGHIMTDSLLIIVYIKSRTYYDTETYLLLCTDKIQTVL